MSRGAAWMPHDMRGFQGMLTDAMRPPWGDITNHGGGWVVGETRVRGLYSRNAAHGTPRAAMQATGSFPVVEVGFCHDRVLFSSLAPSKLPFRPIGGLEVDQRPVSFCLLRRSLMPVAGVVQP